MNTAFNSRFARFVLLFLPLFLILQLAVTLSAGSLAERVLVDKGTVGMAARLIGQVFPQDAIVSTERQLSSRRVSMAVLRGCEGLEALCMVAAAVLAFPASPMRKLFGLTAGLTFIYALNQLRLLALYWTVRDFPKHFALMHAYVAPTVLVLAIVLYFWIWTIRGSKRRAAI